MVCPTEEEYKAMVIKSKVKISQVKVKTQSQGQNSLIFSLIFQRKISANRLALVGMARMGGQAASTIRLKFWLKFCFLTIT